MNSSGLIPYSSSLALLDKVKPLVFDGLHQNWHLAMFSITVDKDFVR